MKFRFAFDKLLKHRKSVEDMARRDHVAAQRATDSATESLNKMYDDVDKSREHACEIARLGGEVASLLNLEHEFITGMKSRIEAQRLKIRELKEESERKLEILVEAAKERKTLDKLKERRLEAHKRLVKKAELKTTDEIVTTRFKRGHGI